MANTNRQAVSFSNNKLRPMSELFYTTYQSAKSVVDQWNAQNVSAVLPNDSTALDDGSPGDGRAPITNAQAVAIITRCIDFINWCEGSTTIAVGDKSKAVLNTIAAVQSNGGSRL